jgi:hypothetical protein
MRLAGTIQSRSPRSISLHCAPMTSAVLAAVEFQRPGGAPLLLAQQIDESAGLAKGQRRMVLDRAHLRLPRQQVFEMASPAVRVLASPISARRRPIEDAFDAAAYPAGGLRPDSPDRLDRLRDEPDIDCLDR